jgi:hypothetical protein
MPVMKVLAPNARAVISVVFLPRVLGSVDATLVIQTNLGLIHYQLHGEVRVKLPHARTHEHAPSTHSPIHRASH